MNLEEARRDWVSERPIYEALAGYVKEALRDAIRAQGIACSVDARAKELDSLLKKLIRNCDDPDYQADPLGRMGDKSGARVVVVFPETVDDVEVIVHDLFCVQKREDKTIDLRHNQLGYLGVHLDVSIPMSALDERIRGLRCEIQIHTRAQNLWNDSSHRLDYKGELDLPSSVRRRIYRLAALVEIFDQEVQGARDEIMAHPRFRPTYLLNVLERQYYRLTAREFDRQLSFDILRCLEGTVADGEWPTISLRMEAFVDRNEAALVEIFSRDPSSPSNPPTLFQPETIFVFERLESDRFALEDAWSDHFELDWLVDLETLWAEPIDIL